MLTIYEKNRLTSEIFYRNTENNFVSEIYLLVDLETFMIRISFSISSTFWDYSFFPQISCSLVFACPKKCCRSTKTFLLIFSEHYGNCIEWGIQDFPEGVPTPKMGLICNFFAENLKSLD